MCAICRIHNGLKILFCFRHTTSPHYYHNTGLFRCVEQHIVKGLDQSVNNSLCIFCRQCVSDVIYSSAYLLYLWWIWGWIFSAYPFEFKWSKGYICNIFFASNQKYQPSPLLTYFYVAAFLGWLCHHILSDIWFMYILREIGLLFPSLLCILWCSYNAAWRSYPLVLHYFIISSMQTYAKHWTCQMMFINNPSRVCLRSNLLSQSSCM